MTGSLQEEMDEMVDEQRLQVVMKEEVKHRLCKG